MSVQTAGATSHAHTAMWLSRHKRVFQIISSKLFSFFFLFFCFYPIFRINLSIGTESEWNIVACHQKVKVFIWRKKNSDATQIKHTHTHTNERETFLHEEVYGIYFFFSARKFCFQYGYCWSMVLELSIKAWHNEFYIRCGRDEWQAEIINNGCAISWQTKRWDAIQNHISHFSLVWNYVDTQANPWHFDHCAFQLFVVKDKLI